jgi:hypothetical protein
VNCRTAIPAESTTKITTNTLMEATCPFWDKSFIRWPLTRLSVIVAEEDMMQAASVDMEAASTTMIIKPISKSGNVEIIAGIIESNIIPPSGLVATPPEVSLPKPPIK